MDMDTPFYRPDPDNINLCIIKISLLDGSTAITHSATLTLFYLTYSLVLIRMFYWLRNLEIEGSGFISILRNFTDN